MTRLTQQELQTLRHLIGSHETASQKLKSYAQQVTDNNIKHMFESSAQEAENSKQKLISFLS